MGSFLEKAAIKNLIMNDYSELLADKTFPFNACGAKEDTKNSVSIKARLFLSFTFALEQFPVTREFDLGGSTCPIFAVLEVRLQLCDLVFAFSPH